MLQLWVRGDLLVLLERSLLQHRVSTEPLAQVKIQSHGFALKYSFWNIESAFCFLYSYCYGMICTIYENWSSESVFCVWHLSKEMRGIICALQGTIIIIMIVIYNLCSPGNTRKVAGGSAKCRQRVRGRGLLPTHMWSEYLAVTQTTTTTTTTTKPLQIII